MSRIDDIRKRHRNRKTTGMYRKPVTTDWTEGKTDLKSSYQKPVKSDHEGLHPLFRTNIFVAKCLLAACLVLAAGIVYKQSGKGFDPIKSSVATVMTNDFKFAQVSNWYEDTLGSPLAFLPMVGDEKVQKKQGKENGKVAFAEPVSGQVTRQFSDKSKGVMVQTAANSSIKAVKDGLVLFVGEKDDTGKTVVIQHDNGAESWYGELDEIEVKPYDYVKKEQVIGKVTDKTNKKYSSFYFALKEGGKFIDPIQVMSFE